MPAICDLSRRATLLLLALGLASAGPSASPARAQEPEAGTPGRRVLMRLAADSGVVGHFKFTGEETSRLVFDILDDDPRAALLASVTEPRRTVREIAGTIVSTPASADEDRRYLIYWLGYRLTGEEGRSLTSMQWDSIFQKAGRRAVLRFTARGQPRGVEVSSEAVRPVAQSLANVMSGLALTLPADSVGEGSRWQDAVAVPVSGPDGSRELVVIQVTYRLTQLDLVPDGLKAHIEFDGEPVRVGDDAGEVSGQYFGESVFSVSGGRYEQMLAVANLEVKWNDTSGLPPSRTLVEWQGLLTRR